MKLQRLFSLMLVLFLLFPPAVSAEEMTADTRIEARYTLDTKPDHWNPLKNPGPEGQLILDLTAAGLYSLSPDGQDLISVLASDLPRDVTGEFAGQYGIPADATRSYAFRIKPDPGAYWDDGTPITTADFLTAFRQKIERKGFPLELALLEEYYNGTQKTGSDIISLRNADFSSVEEAENAGYSLFYVDTTRFWGLDSGWVCATDRTRLKDSAIPSGVTEMYVSGAYLYDRYLRTGCETDVFQREFVGICKESSPITQQDIGLVEEEDAFVLILSHPATAEYVALQLAGLYPVRESIYADNYATGAKSYRSCGPYRIVSVTEDALVLEPNPHWLGRQESFRADLIRLEIGT